MLDTHFDAPSKVSGPTPTIKEIQITPLPILINKRPERSLGNNQGEPWFYQDYEFIDGMSEAQSIESGFTWEDLGKSNIPPSISSGVIKVDEALRAYKETLQNSKPGEPGADQVKAMEAFLAELESNGMEFELLDDESLDLPFSTFDDPKHDDFDVRTDQPRQANNTRISGIPDTAIAHENKDLEPNSRFANV